MSFVTGLDEIGVFEDGERCLDCVVAVSCDLADFCDGEFAVRVLNEQEEYVFYRLVSE